MMRHIERLASDEFQGRAPGTEGERLTINYIAEQLAARGAEPAGEGGTWFQPVRLVERRPGTSQPALDRAAAARSPSRRATSSWSATRRARRIADAPVIFAGHGARMPERGIDQLAGANLNGAVVLIMLQPPQGVSGFPSLAQRTRTVTEAGAAAVIAIVGDEVPWAVIVRSLGQGTTRLDSTPVPRITGVMPAGAAQRLIAAAGGDFARLLNDQPGSSFRADGLAAPRFGGGGDRRQPLQQQQCGRPDPRQRQHRRTACSCSAIGTISASAGPKARRTGSATAPSTMPAASR